MPRRSKKSSRATTVAVTVKGTRPQGNSRRRRPRRQATLSLSVPTSYSPLAAHCFRYIESLFSDRLLSGVCLPAFGYTRRSTPFEISTRTPLIAGTTNLNAAVAVNPYHSIFESVSWEKPNTAAAEIVNWCYTAFHNAGTYTNGAIPNGADQVGVGLSGQIVPTTAEPMEGSVRIHGIKFRLEYFGTELNKGGLIYAIHNPEQKALLHQYEANNTTNTNGTLSSMSNVDAATYDTETVAVKHIGDSFEFVWRPQSLDFKNVQSFYPAIGAHATAVAGNPLLESRGILGAAEDQTMVAPLGWTTGFILRPATATADTALPYMCDITIIGDYRVNKMDSAAAPQNVSFPTILGTERHLEDPALQAHLHNALSHVHTQRAMNANSSRSKNLSVSRPGFMQTAKKLGRKGGKDLLAGAASEAGSWLAKEAGSLATAA